MFSSSRDSPRRKASNRGFKQLGSKSKLGLAVDTSFSRHQGQAPQQVFPYESRTQELSFVSLTDVPAQSRAKKGGLKLQLENRLLTRPSAQRSTSDKTPAARVHNPGALRPGVPRSQTSSTGLNDLSSAERHPLPVQPVHKRIKGLRPSPLDLANDVSPSDRAITIGLAVPSASISTHTPSPHSPGRDQHPLRRAEEAQTPTILITPARDDFGLSLSPEDMRHTRGYRPVSSVYSNCAPQQDSQRYTPPVPSLPLFANPGAPRQSAATVFEEDSEFQLEERHSRCLTAHSQLPTPRRSRGWWNLVTSPFSASSKSSAFFWCSPSLLDAGHDRARMLDDASDMGTTDYHAGVIFSNRTPDDDELRTALPLNTGSERPSMPVRSDTAPGALDANAAQVNIYRVYSQGMAAAYYDTSRHYPSMLPDGKVGLHNLHNENGLEGWSPSQSVAHAEIDEYASTDEAGTAADVVDRTLDDEVQKNASESEDSVMQNEEDERDRGPFADSHQLVDEESQCENERALFSTPSEEELKGATPPRPVLNDRSNTQATLMSAFSPLSATPVIEEAHIARVVGPSSENGELREVQVTPARSLSPPSEPSSAAADLRRPTTGARPVVEGVMLEKAPCRPILHSRNDSSGSFGLGISDAGGEKELFPPPKLMRERARLGTDRFGQLTIRSAAAEGPSVPWYRRFFWGLISIAAIFLLLGVVLLVVLVAGRTQTDMAVQAKWLNLTGFPAMPTGVATVIQPKLVKAVSGCVSPQSLWSCDMPADQQAIEQSTTSELPNFRLEIRFRNGTVAKNETQLARRALGSAASAGAFVRRDGWTSSVHMADPAAPSGDDQMFLGEYTDDISVPYDGEQTPFYISLLNSSALITKSSKLDKRQSDPYPYPTTTGSNTSTTSSDATTDPAISIPRPALQSHGRPADAEAYPFAEAHPLRLYNRGQDNEHYGFYVYFDRSLYVSNVSTASSSSNSPENGTTGSVPLDNASAVCTWSQTRFHIQIWTRKQVVASLSDPVPLNGLPAANSTANDMEAPGSFPYPVTVTLDRHGGHAKKKGVYCYGLDIQHHVVESVKIWVGENRAFDGDLVNAAAVPSSNGTSLTRTHKEMYGGIDGGSGGCACQWQNWT